MALKNIFGNLDTGIIGKINNSVSNITSPKSQYVSNVGPMSKPTVISSSAAISPTATKITPPTQKNPVINTPAAQQYINGNIPYLPQNHTLDNPTNSNLNNTGNPTPTENSNSIPTPEVPKIPSATDTAFSEYIKSLQPSSGVTEAKTAYNDYVANVSKSSANIGYKRGESGGTLGLARGEEAKFLSQAQPEATRLQNAIGIAQDEQTNKTAIGKAGLDYALNRESIKSASEKQAYDRLTSEQKTAYDKTQDTIKNEQVDKKFEEDKKQFGMDYALKAKELAIKQNESNAKLGETATSNIQKQQEATGTMGLIDNLLNNKSLGNISGGIIQRFAGGLAGDAALAKNQYEQLKGMLALENRSKLKGQGAVSDFEGRVLESAASSLGRNLSDGEFVNQLKQIRGAIATSHGLSATISVRDPRTGEHKTVDSDSAGISQAIKDGLLVTYQ